VPNGRLSGLGVSLRYLITQRVPFLGYGLGVPLPDTPIAPHFVRPARQRRRSRRDARVIEDVRDVRFVLREELRRELIYTGITRAQSALTVASKNASALADGIGQSARRSSGLRGLLEERPVDG